MNQCCIRNHANFPVPGGWGFVYNFRGQNFQLRAPSPQRVVDAIAKIHKNNDAFNGYEEIWNICNENWARRAPDRLHRDFVGKFGGDQPPLATPSIPHTDHWKMDPAYYGPILWHWLHFFGHNFDKESWDRTIERIGVLLDPERSPDSGCPTCYGEWKAILSFMSPGQVNSAQEAARWSFDAHNHVNKKLGKPIRGWSQAAKLYGWKVAL